jgi:hypothetical protein
MSTSTSVFPFAHIALTAAITAGLALLVLVVLRTRSKALRLSDCLLVALVASHAAHRVAVGRQYRRVEQRSHSKGRVPMT